MSSEYDLLNQETDELVSGVIIENFVPSINVDTAVYCGILGGIAHPVGGDFKQAKDFWSSPIKLL